ncbi:hypothetical protein Ahy_B03g068093 isoform C [Arachis hypogaea]|uniref:Uncharacterized protein n=1 Tax=Arachis hypogaea TaxID=3818 RepID=A0A445A8Q2_ARAHY|nr:hypothetical protein Ahy_B03g068093 isoform C [Arachis hypogaea]
MGSKLFSSRVRRNVFTSHAIFGSYACVNTLPVVSLVQIFQTVNRWVMLGRNNENKRWIGVKKMLSGFL